MDTWRLTCHLTLYVSCLEDLDVKVFVTDIHNQLVSLISHHHSTLLSLQTPSCTKTYLPSYATAATPIAVVICNKLETIGTGRSTVVACTVTRKTGRLTCPVGGYGMDLDHTHNCDRE